MKHAQVGRRFKEIRLLLKKTQVEFSKELDITQANLSQIENGKCLPNFAFQEKLSSRFPEVNFNWLLHGEGSLLRSTETSKIKQSAEIKLTKQLSKAYELQISELKKEINKLRNDNSKLINALSSK